MLAIALQVWDGDVWLAQRLMDIICSIEKTPRDDVELCISPRRRTNPIAVDDLVKIARAKFPKILLFKNKRRGIDWPAGPNDLWAETMLNVFERFNDQRLAASGVLTMEPDCLPLRPDWIDVLQGEWFKARQDGKSCIGHAQDGTGASGAPTHINGNAVFACDLPGRHPEMNGSDSLMPWDVFHGKLLLHIGADTFAIAQEYKTNKITRAQVEAIRKHDRIPALYHGIKSEVGMEIVKEMIADGLFFSR